MKKVLLFLLAVVLIGVAIGVYMWNKPHPKVENAKSIDITAEALYKAYNANEHAADSMYLTKDADKKALTVTGTVNKLDKNQDGGTMLILETGDPIAGIQCTMREKTVQAATGQKVTVKGFCTGNSITGVSLTDCVLQ